MLTEFGKFCRKLRIDHDELLKDMAEKLGVTPSYLSAIEKGKRKVPTDWGEEIAKHYELTGQQVKELANFLILDELSVREKRALESAVSAIYFTDNSDYLNGLWGVVSALLGYEFVNNDGFNIKEMFTLLQKDEEQRETKQETVEVKLIHKGRLPVGLERDY